MGYGSTDKNGGGRGREVCGQTGEATKGGFAKDCGERKWRDGVVGDEWTR
jgi:hypothetical protein